MSKTLALLFGVALSAISVEIAALVNAWVAIPVALLAGFWLCIGLVMPSRRDG